MVAAPAAGMMFVRLAWFWILASGFGFPMGLPPGPEDPVVANVAPQECLFYVGWASMATPDPKSPNQLEQLFAEPEVQQLVAEAERLVRYSVLASRAVGRDAVGRDIEGLETGPPDQFAPPPGVKRKAAPAKKPPSAAKEEAEAAAMMDEVLWLVKKAISSPGAVYLAKLEFRDPRQPPAIQGGAIVGLGDDAAKVRALMDKYAKQLARGPAETVKIGEATFYRVKPDPEAPTITWGVSGKHFVLGLGDGEAEALVKRMEGKPPEWLAAVRKRLAVERPATVSYLNVKKIVGMIREKAGPEAGPVIGALGLDNFISYASVAGLDKEGYASKSLLATEKEGGDLLAFLGGPAMEAKDLAPIPRDATLAAAARIEPDQIWQTIVSTMAKADPPGAESFLREIGQAEQHLGLKLREDLLQPLGGVWCIYNSPGEGGLVFTGLTAVGQLKDAKRAAATNQKLVSVLKAALEEAPSRRRGEPGIRQFKCAGQDVFMLDLPGEVPVAPSWCLTDKELIVALFPQNVKAYLLRGPEYQSLAAVPEVAEMLKAEPGPAVVSYLNTPDVFRLVYPVVQIMARFMSAQMQREGVDLPLAVLPSAPSIGKHLRPGVTAVRRTKDGLETTARHSLPGQDIGASAPVMVALLLPAVQSAREAARRSQCANNLKQIGLALLNYEHAHGSFPPAYTVDKNGKPLLSWRVLILPYLEQEPLYRQFHLDEPWDSEHNKKLIVDLPLYRCPSGRLLPGKTTYLTVRGKDTIFPGSEKDIDLAAIRDGTAFTIAVVEAGDQSAVDWTRPDDFTPDTKNPTKGLLGHHPNGFNVVMVDNSVHFISAGIDPNVLRALFTRNGREVVDMEQLYGPPRRRPVESRTGFKEGVKEAVDEPVKEAFPVPPSKDAVKPEPRAVDRPKAEPIRVKPIAEPVKEAIPKAEGPKTELPKAEAPPAPQPEWPDWWGFGAARRKAQTTLAKTQIAALRPALETYRLDMGDFPPNDQGLGALRTAPNAGEKTRWRGPYLEGPVPVDPWGRPYQYEYPGKHGRGKPDLWSLGPDGQSGTDDDITSWSDR